MSCSVRLVCARNRGQLEGDDQRAATEDNDGVQKVGSTVDITATEMHVICSGIPDSVVSAFPMVRVCGGEGFTPAGCVGGARRPRRAVVPTEQEGFEPPLPFGKTVFKTVALSRSATAPGAGGARSGDILCV